MCSVLFPLTLHIVGTITFFDIFHLKPSCWLAPLYILRRASGRTDGDDIYGVMVMLPMTIVLVGTSNYSAVLW